MRIFTKKAFKFRVGSAAVSTAALSFADVPDWVIKDPIFELAKEEGSIELIESKTDEKLIETTGTTKQDANGAVDPGAAAESGGNSEDDGKSEVDDKKKAK